MPVDDSLNGTVRLDGDDLMDAGNAGARLEQAAYGGDGRFHFWVDALADAIVSL